MEEAIQRRRERKGIIVKGISRIYETDPVGGPSQAPYLNGVIEIETELEPRKLLSFTQEIENQLGRDRTTVKNGPRTMDLDILTYGDREIDEEDLKIPHPKMNERQFVQKPLRDLLG
jgi:2-amino-4-hydroxy-6-hydroxymethyldihydropteridine diphosphokinase